MATDIELVFERFPDVRIDCENFFFYEGLIERRLLLNRCDECGLWSKIPRSVCSRCWTKNLVPSPISGRGTIHVLTFLHQGPPSPGVDYTVPFPLAAIELVEQAGLRVAGTIVNCPAELMRIGLPVEMLWLPTPGVEYPAFQPYTEVATRESSHGQYVE